MIYLILVLPKIGSGLCVTGVLGGIVSIVVWAIYGVEASDKEKYARPEDERALELASDSRSKSLKSLKMAYFFLFLFAMSWVFPTTKIALAMLAWQLGGEVDGLAELPGDIVQWLRDMLAEEIGDKEE